MANVKCKTLKGFDNVDEFVGPNKTITVSEDRAKELARNGLVEILDKKAATPAANKNAPAAENKAK